MQDQQPIPIPWSQRWRWFRHRGLPPFCFVISIVLCGWLWQQQGALPNAIGEVEAVRVQVNSQSDGQLIPLATRPGGQWELFDRVEAGQLIATLDNRSMSVSLDALAQRAAGLADQLQVASEQIQIELPETDLETLNHALQIEQLRLAGMRYQAELGRDQIRLSRMRLPSLTANDSSNELSSPDQPLESESERRQRLENGIAQHARAVEGVRSEQSQLVERVGNSTRLAELRSQLVAPFQLTMTEMQVNAEKLQQRVQALEVRSPLSGTIMKIHCWPGENLRTGDAVVTIAADQSRHVVSYVLETRGVVPRKGTRVTLRPRTPTAVRVVSVVEVVGPQVERVPSHVASDSQRDEWGIPVRIKLPPDLAVQPGSLLDVTFQQDLSDRL